MRGNERLNTVERTTATLTKELPQLPESETVLIRLLRIAGLGLEEHFQKFFLHRGLTEKSYHALCVLVASKNQQAYPSELSELIGTSRANITKILASLEGSGLVARETGKTDARRSLIKLTAKGIEAVNEITPKIAGPVAEAFAGLSAKELSLLDGLLRKLIISFDQAQR